MNTTLSTYLFAAITNILFTSCTAKEPKPADAPVVNGRFVNNTLLKTIPDTIPGGVAFYCSELSFITADSVEISNGFENFNLACKKQGALYLLQKASIKGDMPLIVNHESSITLVDTAWTGQSTGSEFIKVIDANGNTLGFDCCLNERMIAGEYLLYKENKPTEQKVVFVPDGHVTGLGDYISYSLCYSGDCIEETATPSHTVYFTRKNDGVTVYAFKNDRKNNVLKLFSIAAPISGIKGERAIMGEAFDLRRSHTGR